MKKILLITSCVLLVAACIAGPVFAGGKKEEAAEQKGEMTAPEQKPAGGFSWKQQEGAKLRLMFVQHYFTDSLKPLIPQFEQMTGIKVQLEVLTESEYWNKMVVEFNSGANPPDVFMLNYVTVAQYEAGGWVEPLADYLENTTLTNTDWYDFNDFFPKAIDFGTYKGKLYGLPITGEWQILFYRKDLYEQKGLKVPKTMDELLKNAVALKTSDVAGIVLRAHRTSAAWWPWAGFVRTYGGYWVSPENVVGLTDPQVVAATKMYVDLIKQAGPKGILNYTWYEASQDFQQGRAAHFIDSSGFLGGFENPEKSAVAGKVGYALMPAAKAGQDPVPNVNHWMLGMGSQSKNKEAAYLFLEWATSKENLIKVGRSVGSGPRTSVYEDPELLAKYPAQSVEVSLLSSKIADKQALPQIVQLNEIGQYLAIAINEIFADESNIMKYLREAKDKTQKAMSK
jgi:multiple sugar transport system substrate-binding protein